MKVYIAGSSTPSERARIKHWKQRLEGLGIEVVSTWITSVETYGGNPREATRVARRAWARGCLNEVIQADVFWLLVPPADTATRGAWAELGYAWAELGYACAVAGVEGELIASGDTRQSVFCALAREFAEDEHAFDEIIKLDYTQDPPYRST